MTLAAAGFSALMVTAPAANAALISYPFQPGASITFPGNDVEAISGNFTLPSSSGSFTGSITLTGSGPEAGTYTCGGPCLASFGGTAVELVFAAVITLPGINGLFLDFTGTVESPLILFSDGSFAGSR